MKQKSGPEKQAAEDAIRDIRRATRRHFSAEEKICVVLQGLRGEKSIAELCRREGFVRRNAQGVWAMLESGHEQPVPIFQQPAGSDPSGRDDVRAVPTVAAQR
jgi:hypothetical protein